ncbi:MAG: hypothetical protein HOU81_00100 [Hamadaea sp.]|uniref:hypothetical protein n=1 Tax=Hamadaea sp. TaxID=2024425 RepID=UPI0017EECE2B|nr:hypothetical protein [Hamadaea sp.]NUR69218.1 hypothetical protein [Hamadaea sp.]NUT22306.1 hypothetical protein [Hamadaea sp.]
MGLSIALVTGASLLLGPVAAPVADPSTDPQVRQAIADWFTKGGEKRLTALQSDFETIAKAATATDLPAVEASCGTLKSDVDAAQAYAPLPDAQAQKSWAASLDLYEKAALDCVAGADQADAQLLLKSNDEMTQGSRQLAAATARVQDILR